MGMNKYGVPPETIKSGKTEFYRLPLCPKCRIAHCKHRPPESRKDRRGIAIQTETTNLEEVNERKTKRDTED